MSVTLTMATVHMDASTFMEHLNVCALIKAFYWVMNLLACVTLVIILQQMDCNVKVLNGL